MGKLPNAVSSIFSLLYIGGAKGSREYKASLYNFIYDTGSVNSISFVGMERDDSARNAILIVNNFAPSSNTIHSYGIKQSIDMRYNYWGVLPNGHIGPDDSVWNTHNNIFKPWYKKWINWNPKVIESFIQLDHQMNFNHI